MARKNIAIKLSCGILIFFVFLILSSSAQALEIKYPTLPGNIALSETPKLNEFVRYIYVFSIIVSGLIAFGVAIFGGLLYLLSQGNPVRKALAREWIGAGFLGVFILLLSYIILVTINPQLVGLKEIEFKSSNVPPYHMATRTPLPEQKDIGFQIPMGKLIEAALLSGRKEDGFKDDEFRREIKDTIQEINNLTRQLDPTLFELKNLINQCNCGGSICSGDCTPQGCNVNCDFSTIQDKANQIKNSPVLDRLREKEEKLARQKNEAEKRHLGLHKAVFLATIFFDDVLDWYSFAIEKQETQNIFKRQVEIETLPEWQDIKLSIKTNEGRIIPDPATLYFWKKYKEMDDAIQFASAAIGSVAGTLCPGTGPVGNTICVPSNPGAFIWPAEGKVTLGYGDTSPPYSPGNPHQGIDIANNIGTSVLAAADGVVVKIHTGCPAVTGLNDPNATCGAGFGNHVVLEHKDFDPEVGTIYTIYAHLKEVLVRVGDQVTQRQKIGTMNTTGYAEGSHLHFQVSTELDGNPSIDPNTYLPGDGNTICGPEGSGGGGTCEVVHDPDSPCDVDKLRPYFGQRAEEASQICNREGARPFDYINDACRNGGADYSLGPFQINLYRTCRCPGAWTDPKDPNWCEKEKAMNEFTCPWPPRDKKALDQCAKNYGLGNPDLHYRRAVEIFQARANWDKSGWCTWSTSCPQYCNLCPFDGDYCSRI